MDLLGPFPATESGSTNILVITDRFSKLAQVTPLSSTTAPAVANAFIEHWVIPYGLPAFLLSDNGPQFVGKFFEAICLTLKVKHVATTAYHPQTNGQTERYNQTLATRLRIFTYSNNKDWDRLIQPFTYAYNTQVHRTTGETPFSHVLTRPPPNVVAPPANTMPTSEPLTPEEAKLKVMERTKALVTQAAKTTEERKKKYKAYHDKRLRSQLNLNPGDEVFLNTPPTLGQTPAERMADGTKGKLRKKTLAAFKVLEAYESTAKIVGADGIEDIVSLDRLTKAPPPLDPRTLKPATQSQSSSTRTPTRVRFAEPAQSGGHDNAESQEQTTLKTKQPQPPAPTAREQERQTATKSATTAEEGDEYVVEKILAYRKADEGPEYLIKWYGYKSSDNTWEPAAHIPANMRTRFHVQEAKKSEYRKLGRRGRRHARRGE